MTKPWERNWGASSEKPKPWEREWVKEEAESGEEGSSMPLAASVPLEFMGAVNRGATELVDFVAGAVPNWVAYAAGSDWRMPRLTDALEAGTAGNFMEEGLSKDVVRQAGEVIPAAASAGGMLRQAAARLPQFGTSSESAIAGAIREVGKTSAAADIGLGATSGAGSELGGEVGEYIGGRDGRQVGEMLGALALPVVGTAVATNLARKPATIPRGVLADENGVTREGARFAAQGKIEPAQLKGALDTVEQKVRSKAFSEVGVKPTRAQLTRNADDFREQQEAGKYSGAIRGALEEQDSALTRRVDELASRTGGASREAHEAGYAIEDVITRRALDDDALASNLYQKANEIAGGQPKVLLKGFNKLLKDSMTSDDATNGVLKAIKGRLQRKGLLLDQTPSGINSAGMSEKHARLTPKQVEREVRQVINEYWDSTSGVGRRILSQLKDAVDKDVFTSTGDDFYKEARAAFEHSRKSLEAVKKHKFWKNEKSVVKQILEGRVAPEDIFNRLVVGKSGKVDDIKLLKNYLNSGGGEASKAAWNDLRAQTLMHLRDRATKALATNQRGDRTFNGGEFRKAIEGIGKPKLRQILSAEELEALEKIAKVGELRIPVPGTALGDGPTSVAVNSLKESLGIIERASLKLLELGYRGRRAKGVLDAEIIDMPVIPTRESGKSLAPLVGALDAVN
ncbi:hypothetical protein [Microbulbifer sp. THAF38]|uniref:hypothetical protein n=1 Tax=Microbulbifer sp. THAF38 TaxID=2587856 RepID=UPI001268F920|nr:hypothetical protein [Microbulbifer sp. THAF38]QFT55571.1 hypothetical protein FIU95_13535 [Microbulbifer sp. THAF38]